ncbi:MAG: hypothetical protein CMH55_03180 [Myxococcales bacterium]|nr:hypothetical protein [Myxococcales bacterium]
MDRETFLGGDPWLNDLGEGEITESQQDTQQRILGIRLIAGYAVGICLVYLAIYALVGLNYLAGFNLVFAGLYTGVRLWPDRGQMRALGIVLMGLGTIHLLANCFLFIPPNTGSHYFILLIPILSLVAIHPSDRFWWAFFSISNLAAIVFLEWARDDFVPLFPIPHEPDHIPYWRAVAVLVTLSLVIIVFRSFHRDLHRSRKALHLSYERSESLLLNILPWSIAERLKGDSEPIADDFEEASVLFADLVGFTEMADRQTAAETVALLNGIFSDFDAAVDRHELEKIKTIGDAYMVAAGVPKPRSDHASALLEFAVEMLEIIEDHNQRTDLSLNLRIGVSTGPLTAGVIGSRKFTYDIWGDTVNMASRMESTGVAGRVQVTAAVAQAAHARFVFEDRGSLDIKGKGPIQAFLLAGQTEGSMASAPNQPQT